LADRDDQYRLPTLTSTKTADPVESVPPGSVNARNETFVPLLGRQEKDHAGTESADDGSPARSVVAAGSAGLEVQPLGAAAAIADEDHRTNLARFRFAMGGGLIVCILFAAVDWMVVVNVHPTAFLPFLVLRLGIIATPLISLIATYKMPRLTPRVLNVFDLASFTLVAAMISLMCVEFNGITSPYYAGVIVVVVCRGAAMPTNWRSGLLYFGLPAATFPGIILGAALFSQRIWTQLQNRSELTLFSLNVIFIASSLLLVIIGSHAVWALRRQLYATGNLGRYRLTERIGAGGMGEVWRAHHPGIKRDVAIKILRPERSHHASGVARFEREVAATTRLTHPHTVRVFDRDISRSRGSRS